MLHAPTKTTNNTKNTAQFDLPLAGNYGRDEENAVSVVVVVGNRPRPTPPRYGDQEQNPPRHGSQNLLLITGKVRRQMERVRPPPRGA